MTRRIWDDSSSWTPQVVLEFKHDAHTSFMGAGVGMGWGSGTSHFGSAVTARPTQESGPTFYVQSPLQSPCCHVFHAL